MRATNYFKKQKSLGISCEAFIGAYDFCTLSITEVMINILYRQTNKQTNYLNIDIDIYKKGRRGKGGRYLMKKIKTLNSEKREKVKKKFLHIHRKVAETLVLGHFPVASRK